MISSDKVLEHVVSELKYISGVDAVVLGGSYAAGDADKASDTDICVYYDKGCFDINKLQSLASLLDDMNRKTPIAPPGAWGRWLDGGGCITTNGRAVDILLRSTSFTKEVILACLDGNISISYQSGYPFGLVNTTYMAGIFTGIILHEKNQIILELKKLLQPYPEKYRRAAVSKFLNEAEFTLLCAKRSLYRKDILYVFGAFYRCVNCLIQALSALNRVFLLSEKRCLSRLESAGTWLPQGFIQDVNELFSRLTPEKTEAAFFMLQKHTHSIASYIACEDTG